MQNEKPKSYVTIPRYIPEDFADKKITRSEFILCVWLRSISDINGFAMTSATALRDDMFPGVKANTVQKLLLSLRKKGYIYFPNHQGRRGSIRIESDAWLMKTKGTKSIAHRFAPNEVIGDISSAPEPVLEPKHSSMGQNQKFVEQKTQITRGFSDLSRFDRFTSPNNEHNNEQKNENNTVGSTFKGTLTKDFIPTNGNEQRCKEIALEIGDENIDSFLKVLQNNKRGMWAIEKALVVYENDIENGKRIDNPPAYFHGIVKRILLKEI